MKPYLLIKDYSYLIGSYLFLSGSLMMTFDCIKTNPIKKKYLIGCLLFDLGCVFFIIDAHDFIN
jgi:hypothetical protein